MIAFVGINCPPTFPNTDSEILESLLLLAQNPTAQIDKHPGLNILQAGMRVTEDLPVSPLEDLKSYGNFIRRIVHTLKLDIA